MDPIEAFVLALVQGATEFLPISSSAHLIVLPYLFGWGEHPLRFDVMTNAGTLAAAILYFRRDLARVWRRARRHADRGTGRPGLGLAVAVASVPVLAAGYFFYDWIATDARTAWLIAATSIGFGGLLWWADRVGAKRRDLDRLSWADAVWIGLAQALALVPGTSRSGITMTAALLRGYTREEAAHFSFLLAIPVGLAAFVNDLANLASEPTTEDEILPLVIGFVVSGLSAYLVIGWLLAWLRRSTLTPFVVYRVLLGIAILVGVALGGLA